MCILFQNFLQYSVNFPERLKKNLLDILCDIDSSLDDCGQTDK